MHKYYAYQYMCTNLLHFFCTGCWSQFSAYDTRIETSSTGFKILYFYFISQFLQNFITPLDILHLALILINIPPFPLYLSPIYAIIMQIYNDSSQVRIHHSLSIFITPNGQFYTNKQY